MCVCSVWRRLSGFQRRSLPIDTARRWKRSPKLHVLSVRAAVQITPNDSIRLIVVLIHFRQEEEEEEEEEKKVGCGGGGFIQQT